MRGGHAPRASAAAEKRHLISPERAGERAGGQTWGDRHDPRLEAAGAQCLGHCAQGRARPQDRAPAPGARDGAAGLWPARAAAAADRALRGLPARADHGLARALGQAAPARGPRSGLHRLLQRPHRPPPRGATEPAQGLRAPVRDAPGPPGAGRLRPVPGRVHRRARRHPRGLALHADPRAQPMALGALLRRPGSPDRHALPHRRLRRDGRGAFRVALRPDEDRGDRRGCRRGGELQHLARRAAQPLRRGPARLPPLQGENEGQGGAALSLRPAGLLPRSDLPGHGRPQRSVRRLAGRDRQPAHPRHHRARDRRALRRGAAGADRARAMADFG